MELMVGLEPTMRLTTADYKSVSLPFGIHQHIKSIFVLQIVIFKNLAFSTRIEPKSSKLE